jgi:ABC-type lipoprotein export system ATPase subunit
VKEMSATRKSEGGWERRSEASVTGKMLGPEILVVYGPEGAGSCTWLSLSQWKERYRASTGRVWIRGRDGMAQAKLASVKRQKIGFSGVHTGGKADTSRHVA